MDDLHTSILYSFFHKFNSCICTFGTGNVDNTCSGSTVSSHSSAITLGTDHSIHDTPVNYHSPAGMGLNSYRINIKVHITVWLLWHREIMFLLIFLVHDFNISVIHFLNKSVYHIINSQRFLKHCCNNRR